MRPLWPYLKTVYTHTTRVAAPVSIMASQLRGGYLPRGVVATLEEAALSTGGRYFVARPEEVIERRVPVGIPPRHPAFTENVEEVIPRVGVAELPYGRVLSPHSAVISGSDDLVQELSWYFGTNHPHEHPLFLHPFPGMPQEVGGRLGVLATRGDQNFYHFLMDVIPRLGVLEACPEVAPPDLWYVPATERFQTELLDMVGIGPDVRMDSSRVRHVHAECLVVPAPPSMTVRNPPWVVAYLRKRLLTFPVTRRDDRAIYVTRGRGRYNRTVANEDDVVSMLDRRGFDVVDPSQMSVKEQITAFAEASVIVAPHGAALTNLVFASPGSIVIELFPAGAIVADYWKMAGGVPGLEYRYLAGSGTEPAKGRAQMLVSDIVVDLRLLSGMLDEIGRGPTG